MNLSKYDGKHVRVSIEEIEAHGTGQLLGDSISEKLTRDCRVVER